ncbi:MAG: secretin N-terminal domain-containing protein, partial [Planctomycetota bacterium]
MAFGNSRNVRRTVAAVGVLLSLLAGPLAGQEQSDDGEPASFRFQEARTTAVLDALEQLYNVRFQTDVDLPQSISIDSRGPADTEEMLRILDTVLRGDGAVTRRQNGLIRIVPLSIGAAKVELIQLRHGDPEQVADIVNEIFSSPDLLREATAQNAELINQLVTELDRHASPLLTGQMEVTAVPYPRTNAVVIRAPEVSLGTIRQFILTQLDQPSPKREKTEAEKKLEAELKKLNEQKKKLEQEKKKLEQQAKEEKPPEKQRIFRLDYVPASYVARTAQQLEQIRPYVEERLNALILRTRDYEQFEKLEDLIELLDIPEAGDKETYHITLNNADVTDVRNTLRELYRDTLRMPYTQEAFEEVTEEEQAEREEEAAGLLVQAGVEPGAAEEFVSGELGLTYGEVEIISDQKNNALLIQTHPRNIDSIMEVIKQLDRPRGQVMIKVFIAEVTLDNTLETGVDFVYQDPGEDSSQSYSMDFDASPNAPGLTYTYISENIEAFVRALQATSRLDVISRPQVLTLDNQPAVIEFGERVPLIQTTRITEEGTTNATVRYEDVVTRLQVTPHMNAAGFIRMDIQQSIDDVSPDTFAITENLAPRILVTRTAQTNVQVRDGQTVCLGGFIGDTIEETEQKIPLLGDIPIVGRAFSSVKQTRVKSELLIFITPYILRTPEELLSMTNQVRGRTVATRRRDRPAEELYDRNAPEQNPHRGWQRTSRRYTIPGFDPTRGELPVSDEPDAETQPADAQTGPAESQTGPAESQTQPADSDP